MSQGGDPGRIAAVLTCDLFQPSDSVSSGDHPNWTALAHLPCNKY